MVKRSRETSSQSSWKRARQGFAKIGRQSNNVKFARQLANYEEKKYLDTVFTSVTGLVGGSLADINTIAEGSDFNQRIGRKVRSKYLEYDLGVISTGSGTTPSDWTIHLVLDRQPNNTIATVAQILDVSVAPATYAFKNIQLFQERFKILKTIRGQTCTTTATAYQLEAGRTRGYISLVDTLNGKDDITHFAGSASGVPNTNAYYLLFAAQVNGAALLLSGCTRWVYVDM